PAENSLRALLEAKLGDSVQRVIVSAALPDDPARSTSGVSVMIARLPALADIVRDHLEEDVMVIGALQISLQLADGSWIAVTEPGREFTTAMRLRNLSILIVGLAFIAGVSLFAARMVIRPMRQLAIAADRLGRERELTPIPKAGVPELDAIADSFNQMQQRLKSFVR